MIVGTARFHLYLRHAHSLKEKRSVIKSLKDQVGNKFNVSVSETDFQDNWHEAEIGMAAVGTDTPHVSAMLNEVEKFVRLFHPLEVLKVEKEFF